MRKRTLCLYLFVVGCMLFIVYSYHKSWFPDDDQGIEVSFFGD